MTPTSPSSILGTAPKLPVQRIPVQRIPVPLRAYQSLVEEHLEVLGREIPVFPKDWVICNANGAIVDIQSPRGFEKHYQIQIEGRLTLEPAHRAELEKVFGNVLATESPATLVTATRRLASLKIGDVEVNFTPQQWEEIARRADKRGVKVAQYMASVVEKLLQDLWTVG